MILMRRKMRNGLRKEWQTRKLNMITLCFRAWRRRRCDDGVRGSWSYWKRRHDQLVAVGIRNLQRATCAVEGALREDKAAHVRKKITECAGDGSRLLRELRNVSHTSKQRKSFALPALHRPDGTHAVTESDVYAAWEEHFSKAEHAKLAGADDFLQQYHLQADNNFAACCQEIDAVRVREGADLPTKKEYEEGLLHLKSNKAPGRSSLPGEFFKHAASLVADRTFGLVMKTTLRYEEPAQWAGAYLKAIPKGNAISDQDPSRWRQIGLMEAPAKALHKVLREHLRPFLDGVRRPLQCGTRRGVPTAVPAHAVRLHHQIGARYGVSSATLFVDAQQAYYSVVRELLWLDQLSTQEFAELLEEFKDCVHVVAVLEARRGKTSIFTRAGVPPNLRRVVAGMFRKAWFTMESGYMEDIRLARTGTRPGDPMADLLWSYMFAGLLAEVEDAFVEAGIGYAHAQLEDVTLAQTQRPRHDCALEAGHAALAWADDVAFMVSAESASELATKVAKAATIVYNVMRQYGVCMNLKAGKSEAVMAWRGLGAKAARHFVLQEEDAWIQFDSSDGPKHLHVAESCRHLGGIVVARDTVLPEIQARVGSARQALMPLMRPVFRNRNLDLRTKMQVFVALIKSKLLHHASTWTLESGVEQDAFWQGTMTLLRRVRKAIFGAGFTQDLHSLDPLEMLRIERLRHLQKLHEHGSPAIWKLLHAEQRWLRQAVDDLNWATESVAYRGHTAPLLPEDLEVVSKKLAWDCVGMKQYLRVVIGNITRHRLREAEARRWQDRCHLTLEKAARGK